jgi:hypothetical protein
MSQQSKRVLFHPCDIVSTVCQLGLAPSTRWTAQHCQLPTPPWLMGHEGLRDQTTVLYSLLAMVLVVTGFGTSDMHNWSKNP